MDDERKFALIYGVEKFTLEDVKYLANTFKARKVLITSCVNHDDGECTSTYGILLTRTKGNTDWRMLQKLFGVDEDKQEHIVEFTYALALYLGIIGQEDSRWQPYELFSEEEIKEYERSWGDEEDA